MKKIFFFSAVTVIIGVMLCFPQQGHARRGMPDYVVEESCGQDNAGGKKVLIAFATMYGRTFKVAERISETLCDDGYQVDIRFAKDITGDDLTGYDAVILGSNIYVEKWHDDAIAFLEKYRDTLAQKKIAYYCVSALMGMDFEDAPALVQEHYIDAMYEQFPDIAPLDIAAFAGAINYRILTPRDWFMLRIFFMPGGDWTDWEAVEAWAATISPLLQ
jgi:menaquinone-dependent protoporphyrinogen oxidase